MVAQDDVGARVHQPLVEAPQGGLRLLRELRPGVDAHDDEVGTALGRPMAEPTNSTPARVSCRIVSSMAARPPSQPWLFAVLRMSNPARASDCAATSGAVNTNPLVSRWRVCCAIALSRLPNKMCAARSVSTTAAKG